MQAIGTGIGSDHRRRADKRLERFAVRLRQFTQADRFAGECFQWGERLFEPSSQLSGGFEIGRRYESARIVAMQFVPRCLESRERMHEAGRARSWPRTAQNGALKGGYRTGMCIGFGAKPQQRMLEQRQQWRRLQSL